MSRKPYVRPMPKASWWLGQRRYQLYMAREVSCVFIGLYSLGMTLGLVCLAIGPVAWGSFLDLMFSAPFVLFHALALAFTIVHSVSWFFLAPKAMRIPRGNGFVPAQTVLRGHLAVWAVVSLVILVMVGVA